MTELRRLVDVVQQGDHYKHAQLAAMWPELAEAIAGVIEGMTDQDAPREWWPTRAEDSEPEGGPYGLFQTGAPTRDYKPRALDGDSVRRFLAARANGRLDQ